MRGPGTRMPPSLSFLCAMRPPGHVDETQDTVTVGAAHRSAARAWGARPVPFRTRKLSPIAPRVLRGQPVGGQGAADRWTAPSRHRTWKGEASRPPPFLRLRGINDSFTPDDLILFGIELLFKENKTNNKGNCCGRNDQKQDCQSMLLASFT